MDAIIAAAVMTVLAPLVAGLIKTAKARLQNRRGPGLLQPYYDLIRLMAKGSVVSPSVSWIFRAAPPVYFAAAAVAAGMSPAAGSASPFADLFLMISLLALGRFWLALASLDAGSAFGGMGGSREMYLSVLVEPALLLALMTVALGGGTTAVAGVAAVAGIEPFSLPYVLSAIAFFIIVVAETGRVPVDNPDTHLELTMIHEAMVLEYSGRRLALIHWASMLKQLMVLLLFVRFFAPWPLPGVSGLEAGMLWLGAKVVLAALLLAAVETSTNKMRLFRLPGLLSVSGLLSLLALVAQ